MPQDSVKGGYMQMVRIGCSNYPKGGLVPPQKEKGDENTRHSGLYHRALRRISEL